MVKIEPENNIIELKDVKSFQELYKENRINNILTQDIKIVKSKIIPYKIRDDEKLYNIIKQSMFQNLTRELLEVFSEFPNDIFHINCKIKEVDYPYSGNYLVPQIEIFIIAYIFNKIRFGDKQIY